MYAKVIVDIPARPTDRPFDYDVPPELADCVEIGSRVEVPFGPRVLHGFVVGLAEQPPEGLDPGKMRALRRVLDLTPPLTPELVRLAAWMSAKYLCPATAALQVMVPAALKAKYDRVVVLREDVWAQRQAKQEQETLVPDPLRLELAEWLRRKGGATAEALLEKFPGSAPQLKSMLDEGVLEEVQRVQDRMAVKTALTVFPLLPEAELRAAMDAVPARAQKQKDVLAFLLENGLEPIRLSELTQRLDITPSVVKSAAGKGWIELREVEVQRDPYANRSYKRTAPLPLTAEQQAVYDTISGALDAGRHEVFLLQGVTGSGKTEVYLQTIKRCLELDKEAIVLVPEISLTPQMVERFKGRFGDDVAVLHSRLSHGERYDEWRRIARREVRVVIGARSAVFAPFTKLGLIIIDEEHESSYKQEESPKYHARDVAIRRAGEAGAAVVLGSATPSLESVFAALPDGGSRFKLLEMRTRALGRPLPPVRVVDMRAELKGGNRSMFSVPLHKAIAERLHKKEQIVLLLNRRGYATFVMCRTCGYVSGCPHCDIALTYHQSSRTLRCHYCGYAERERTACPDCGSEHIRHFGTGTQRVEEELVKLFPGIRVIRMDVDTTTEKGAHEKWLTMFGNKQADVLLGTQMVAKGLDFPDVTLVGVIAADTVLNLPDFRSAERTFQLLTQVAGRAGRHVLPGEVIVQTYTPEHYSIAAAAGHDYEAFLATELEHRRANGYPPYSRLINITLSHEEVPKLLRLSEALALKLKELAAEARNRGEGGAAFEVLGPVASPIARIKDRYRFRCMVKYRGDSAASRIVRQAVDAFAEHVAKEKLQISVDVDPQLLM
ncbi:primosomal protein DnaI [Gordoniibacillus kamchatkensis]|uniref:Replication restart protein PriA n=1 Tax=Gordoniibacillus kamchatkensis TaxID=1590651 RepID=A0ABR5AJN5_9BACL|nr:primosomal protein N' [Paenibacillus sp. VKM B-2647]KIL41137.1 primosomal protein DnaI [Paenibacillus sp. VKM B-2647]